MQTPFRDALDESLARLTAGQATIDECLTDHPEYADKLRPLLSESQSRSAGSMVIGTVKGDLHDIGKNLVAMMFEGAGFKVVNLGIDLETQVFVDAVKEHKPDLLGMSALLTTTMPRMGEVINALKEAGIRDQVKIMVGGAPVTEDFAKEIGADIYGANAASSVDKGREAIGK